MVLDSFYIKIYERYTVRILKMKYNENYYVGGLKLILYQLQHISPDSAPEWDENSINYFKGAYPSDRLKMIGDGITWHLKHEKINVSKLIPDISQYSESEINKYLEYVLKGLIKTGLYVPTSNI